VTTKLGRAEGTASWKTLVRSRNAAKEMRRIELGWLNGEKVA